MPSTSSGATKQNGSPSKFKKCRDNLKNQNFKRRWPVKRLQSITDTSANSSISQRVTKKLLRSIKRRRNVIRNKANNLRKKLDFLQNKSGNNKNRSLEDGEIESDSLELVEVDDNNSSMSTAGKVLTKVNYMEDEDCICLEPEIPEIVIDDDEISGPSMYSSQPISSTPREISESGELRTFSDYSNIPPNSFPFFEDINPTPWFETFSSTDTFGNNNEKEKASYNGNSTSSSDVIFTESSSGIINSTLKPTSQYNTSNADDSVIFVSETPGNYIPVVTNVVPNPLSRINRNCNGKVTPKNQKTHYDSNLFTRSEKKQLNDYNTNTYNPSADQIMRTKQRTVIIDGSNVAFNHARSKEFSVKGLKICVEYFEKMKHSVKVVIPSFRMHKNKSSDPEELENMNRMGKIVTTPCKNLPGKSSTSYDDRFILQLACELDGVIISNDNYRDLIHENTAFKKIIENRVVGYTWCDDIFILPKDPYGKWGPPLDLILNRH